METKEKLPVENGISLDEEMEVFPTPITVIPNFLDEEGRNNLISYAKNNISFVDHPTLSDGSKSSFYTHKSVLSSYKDLEKKIELEIIKVAKRMGLPDVVLANSWINIQTKNTILKKHNHLVVGHDSLISGVIYLKVDEDSSKLCFFNPNPYISVLPYENQNKFNYQWFCIQPKNGDLILFPSWLNHGSGDLNKSKERIVLSFNGILKRITIQHNQLECYQ
jgi:uncharacterized protein (TIGR02466 family)